MTLTRDASRALHSARHRKLVCIGDVMLDRFVYGDVVRISPEAPIPVLRQHRVDEMLGAAGNVARNVAALGGRAALVGLVGEDEAGRAIAAEVDAHGQVEGHLTTSAIRPTTVKTRYVSSGQQILRVDAEASHDLSPSETDALSRAIEKACDGASAVMVSDYDKGVVAPDIIARVLEVARAQSIPIILDPKSGNYARYGAVTCIKPNAAELAAATGLPTGSDTEVERALKFALEAWPAQAVLVTRAARGLSFLKRGGEVVHLPGEPVEVFDVSGAGDTSLAGLGIGLAAGADLGVAAELALKASRTAVTKRGTATVTAAELHGLDARVAGALSLTDTLARVRAWREAGLRIGFTNGCFDILHSGHLKVLEGARAACDRLVLGLNSDASVARLKGPARPINTADERARLLAALTVIDAVVVFEEDTPADLVEAIQPDVLVKGGDYTPDTVVGAETVQARGGEVIIIALEDGKSTTGTIERIRSAPDGGE